MSAATPGIQVLGDVGVVVIGRNEGARLQVCLDSLQGSVASLVYADSASTDGSPERVRARGLEVVELERSRPLNAARGRNAGLARLLELWPELEYVFFVDGDCRVVPDFLASARTALARDPSLGAVCGRRRELAPEASIYNRAVDCEWNTPVGPTESFGGDVLVRVRALRATGGYEETLNQGEDPEFAYRMRRAGFGILRLDADMTLHDVALLRLSAWRRRHQRGGYAFAHAALLHWRESGRHNQRALASILAWGLGMPLLVLATLWPTRGLSLAGLALYGFLWSRIRAHRLQRGDAPGPAARYAVLIALGKLDEAVGALRCFWALATRRETLTLEYRDAREATSAREAA
jgi:GT2 family glycosyltransferase